MMTPFFSPTVTWRHATEWLLSSSEPMLPDDRTKLQEDYFELPLQWEFGLMGLLTPILYRLWNNPKDTVFLLLLGLFAIQTIVGLYAAQRQGPGWRLMTLVYMLGCASQLGLNAAASLLSGDIGTTLVALSVEHAMISALVIRNSALPRLAFTQVLFAQFFVVSAFVAIDRPWSLLLAALGPVHLIAIWKICSTTHRLLAKVIMAQSQSERIARTDALTSLLNRRGLIEHLTELTESTAADHGTHTLIAIDLDHFKPINDTYGHATGDAVLSSVARRLRDAVPDAWPVARFGGDEFTILAHDLDERDAGMMAERLMNCLKGPYEAVDVETIMLGASYGLATLRPGDTAASFLARADAALYVQKHTTRTAANDAFKTVAL